MILYYKTSDGEFIPIRELEAGLWRVAEIEHGKEISLMKECDLPKAIRLSQFYYYKTEIAKDLQNYLDVKIGFGEEPKVGEILEMIEAVIRKNIKKKGAKK